MINIFTTATVMPSASRVRVSALLPVGTGMGASIEGRHMGVDAGFTRRLHAGIPQGRLPGRPCLESTGLEADLLAGTSKPRTPTPGSAAFLFLPTDEDT